MIPRLASVHFWKMLMRRGHAVKVERFRSHSESG